MTSPDHPIAVMDATCALCSWGARMIHRMDRSGEIRIAPIQSETGAALMRFHGLDPSTPIAGFSSSMAASGGISTR